MYCYKYMTDDDTLLIFSNTFLNDQSYVIHNNFKFQFEGKNCKLLMC